MGFAQWFVATTVAAVVLTSGVLVFAFSTFETKEHAKETTEEDRAIMMEIKENVKWVRDHVGK
jgi:di/tricarboxylate transporter